MRRLIPLFCVLLTLLAACSTPENTSTRTISPPDPLPSPGPTTTAPPQIDSSPSPTAGPAPESTPDNLPGISYQLDAAYSYREHRLKVEQHLHIPHPGSEPIDELVLAVPPNDWPGALTLESMRWENGQAVEEYRLERIKLTIPFTEPWLPGSPKSLQVKYSLTLPEQNAREGYGPSPFGYTELQVNLVDWYPMVPPYQAGRGWIVHEPWIFGEYLVYPAADFRVNLQIIDGPEVVVAASAEDISGTSVRSYHLEKARNVALSISPQYQVLEEQVGDTTVHGYYFPGYRGPAEAAFRTTVEALELYSSLYGPYDQSSLSMVQADFNHGMEYEGLYFQSGGFFDTYNGNEKNFLTIIAAHETAHQWFYGQVASDQALEPWLDEALCTFSELVYYENLHPDAVDWWRAARIDFYEPDGPIDGSIYDYQDIQDQYLAYRDATYLQGAKFLIRLRETLGEDRFFAFLREYLSRYDGEIAGAEDFFSLLENYTELDNLTWLGEYFHDRTP